MKDTHDEDERRLKTCVKKHGQRNPLLVDVVYQNIFIYLSPPDLQRCMQTTPTWEAFLKPTRTLFLFEMVLPFLMKKISKNEFLTCRLVCQKWKQSIDKVYESHPERLTCTGIVKFLSKCKPDNGIKFEFESPCNENIKRFLKDMESHRGNPFVGRKVLLMAYDPDECAIRREDRGILKENSHFLKKATLHHWR